MTVSIAQVDVNTDKWRDLFEKLNETIYALNNNVASNVGTVSGNVRVGGFVSANHFVEGGNRLVQQTRSISVEPIWMTGGGNLSSDLNLKFTPRLLAALSKAENALTADDFTGTLGFKTKVQIDDIQTTGVANSSTILFGDGVWRAHIPAGVMQKSIFDPTNVSKDAFNRAFHHGEAPTSAITGLDAFIASAEIASRKGQPDGYAGLDSTGRVPLTQIPDEVLGTEKFQGEWNATTNTPKIPVAGIDNKGWYYVVSVRGNTNIDGNDFWLVNDLIISNGEKWSRVIKNLEVSVTSVNGEVGNVQLDAVKVGAVPDTRADEITLNTDNRHSHTNKAILDATTASYTSAEKTKLSTLEDRANHTGTQSIETITGLTQALNDKATKEQGIKADKAVSYEDQTLTEPQQAQARDNIGLGNVANKTEAQMVSSGAIADALDGKQPSLGFTPVQQGGFAGVGDDQVMIGWNTEDALHVKVDNTDFGSTWPISILGEATSLGEGWGRDFIQNQLNWRLTDTRFNGYTERGLDVRSNVDVGVSVGESSYVIIGVSKSENHMNFQFRQPQIHIPNVGWRALGSW